MNESTQVTSNSRVSELATAINILTAPGEALRQIHDYPSKLFPLALVMLPTIAVMLWYFLSVDYEWYVDDTLSQVNLQGEELAEARDAMLSMSPNTFLMFGMLGSTIFIVIVYLLQAMYLSLASALVGVRLGFGHWFSLACWTGLPYLVSVLGMAVNIALNSNGQLGAYELDPLTLANLGIQTDNGSLSTLLNAVSLTMLWGLVLLVIGYRQWLATGWIKAIAVIGAPYLLILGVWAYFAVG